MELLMWLEQVYVWRLQRKEKEAMFGKRNDEKITEEPRQPGLLHGYGQVEMYGRATEEARRVYASGDKEMIAIYEKSVPESYRNEFVVRAIDDARHGGRR